MKKDDDVLAECGLDLDVASASLARVFALVTTPGLIDKQDVEPEETHPGWYKVAERAAAMFSDTGDDEVTLTCSQFGSMLRTAFARASDGDPELCPFEDLPPPVRVGWEHVARHAANIFNLEPKEVSRLGMHEEQMASRGLAKLNPPTP